MSTKTKAAKRDRSVLEAARALYPLIDAEAAAIEKAGTLTAPVVRALKDAGVFDILVPRELGGRGVDVLTALEVFEEISRANVAAGWAALVNGTVAGCVATYLSDKAAQDVFGDGTAIMAGAISGAGGNVKAVEGGHEFDGYFRFGSATAHSTWIAGAGPVLDDAGNPRVAPWGAPFIQVALVPRNKVELRGNWDDVMGLRGSGSYDYAIAKTFVPDGYSFLLLGDAPRRNRPLGHLGVAGLIAIGQAAFSIGAAQRAIEEITAIAPKRSRVGYVGPLVDQQMFQYDYGYHEAALDSVRAYVRDVFATAEAYALEHDATQPPAEFMRLQQATCYAHRVAMDVIRFCFQWAGSHAVHASPLERIFRDMETSNQHLFYDHMNFIRRAKLVFGLDLFPNAHSKPA